MGRKKEIYEDIADESVEIRLSRAKLHNTPPELLRLLSRDRFWFVRDFVASNPNTPEDCLLELTFDNDFRVRQEAVKTLDAKTVHFSLFSKIQDAERRISSNPEFPSHSMDFER